MSPSYVRVVESTSVLFEVDVNNVVVVVVVDVLNDSVDPDESRVGTAIVVVDSV